MALIPPNIQVLDRSFDSKYEIEINVNAGTTKGKVLYKVDPRNESDIHALMFKIAGDTTFDVKQRMWLSYWLGYYHFPYTDLRHLSG